MDGAGDDDGASDLVGADFGGGSLLVVGVPATPDVSAGDAWDVGIEVALDFAVPSPPCIGVNGGGFEGTGGEGVQGAVDGQVR